MTGQTGVEMEALTAVSVACLTLYDMLKAIDRSMTIEAITVDEKHGGRERLYARGPMHDQRRRGARDHSGQRRAVQHPKRIAYAQPWAARCAKTFDGVA